MIKLKGITLIALVITIIVMLILVGVTINVVLNGNLIENASDAKDKQAIERDKELLYVATLGCIKNGKVIFEGDEGLDKNLPDGFYGTNGKYTKGKNKFYVKENGEVTEETDTYISKYDVEGVDLIPREDLTAFVLKRFKASGLEVSGNVMRMIIEETGYFNRESDYNLYSLNNDITKMIALASSDDKKTVTEEVARESIEGDIESSAIDFMNYLSAGEKNKAFKLLNNILDLDSDAFGLIGFMVSQFELILGIRELMDARVSPSIIQSKLNIPKWRYDKLRPYASRMEAEKLRSILKKIYEIDRNIKTGELTSRLAIEMIIAEV